MKQTRVFLTGAYQNRGLSRREALRTSACLVSAGTALSALPACSEPAAAQRPGEDDSTFLERVLQDTDPHIPVRSAPYQVNRTLVIPAGKTVTIDPDTQFAWTGPSGAADQLIGVFEAGGDNVSISASRDAFVTCDQPSPFVYAALMRGHRGFSVTNIQARECGHVHVGPTVADYEQIILNSPGAAGNILIAGGGARYAALQRAGHGACYLAFISDAQVRGARYYNACNGVQWWGGDADPMHQPSQGLSQNERKCRDLVIENVVVEHCTAGGIWGSMGSNIVVRDCTVSDAGDVAYDAEGSNHVTFIRCTARNGHNGCFTTFFLCNSVRIVDCTGIVDNKAFPLVRIYNASQTNWDNVGLEVTGGSFECRDTSGPSTIDTAMGPVGTLLITGAALKNVRIDVAYSNMHRTMITNNTLNLPYTLGTDAAIRAGCSKSLGNAPAITPGGVILENNEIRYSPQQNAAGTAVAILLREDDFNSSASDVVRNNKVSGPFQTGISLINASTNTGIVPAFVLSGNRFEGLPPSATLLSVTRATPVSHEPTVKWDATQMRDGKAVSLSKALD